MIEWVVDQPGLRLGLGDSVDYDGDADLVFSHLYGPLPKQLIGKPAIVNVYGDRWAQAERWCGADLHEVSKWGHGLMNTIYVANMEAVPSFDLRDCAEDECAPGKGWFPEEMCLVLLTGHRSLRFGGAVFDGFMGRGTVGRAALKLGNTFVGIDRDPARVALAQQYLGV